MGAFVFLLFVGVVLIIGYFVMRKIDRKLSNQEGHYFDDQLFDEFCENLGIPPKKYGVLNGNGKSRVKKTNRLKFKFRSKL